MLKRLIYVVVFAVVLLGLIVLIILKRTDTVTPASLFEAIPGDAVIIVEKIDYNYLSNEFLEDNAIWRDLTQTESISSIDSTLRLFFKEIEQNEELEKILGKESLTVSFHLVGKDKLQPIFFVDYSQYHSSKEFSHLILDFLGDMVTLSERRYETELIYDVSGNNYWPDNFSFTCMNGIFFLSPSSMLIEESVRVLNTDGGFADDPGFQKIVNTSGRYVHANVYFNYRVLNQLFFPFTDHNRWDKLDWLEKFANWGELDVDIKRDAIVLNGMTYVTDSLPFFLGCLKGQSPVKIELTEILPSNTYYFIHLGIDDRDKFNTEILKYLADKGERIDFDKETDRIKSKYGIEPVKDLLEVVDNEIAWFSVEGSSNKITSDIFVIESKSETLARSKLHNWYEQYLRVNRFEPSQLLIQFKLDEQTSFDIYRLPDQFYENQRAGKFFGRYYTIFDKYILFGPSVEAISTVIYQNILHKTLQSNPIFEEVLEYFSDRSNLSLFIKPYTYLSNQTGILNDETEKIVTQYESLLRKIPGMIVQYSNEGDMFYNNMVLKYSSHIKERALTEWESLLDTIAIIKPSLVINHNTSEKEIFIQDAGNKIYLINGTGRILWSLQLEAPIMSNIYQIDFYKNNKLQLLFNTKEKLHLIDRNGNYVERYPVNLRSHATNPIGLFDYDNSRDYRIFIAGIDRKIYLYDKEGNILTDWKFRKTEGIVAKPVQHFRVDEKDYIIVADPLRTYILDRRGKERVKLKEQIMISQNNQLYLDMNIRSGNPRWITTDTTGNIVCFYENGNVETMVEYDATSQHFFRMQDMDRDGIPDFIFSDDNELIVINSDGERLFSYKTKETITLPPDVYKFSASDIKIGLTNAEIGRIYLVNSDGSLHEGFPLEGNTRFSIGYFAGSDSRFNLIVGSSNSFLYNYSIE